MTSFCGYNYFLKWWLCKMVQISAMLKVQGEMEYSGHKTGDIIRADDPDILIYPMLINDMHSWELIRV